MCVPSCCPAHRSRSSPPPLLSRLLALTRLLALACSVWWLEQEFAREAILLEYPDTDFTTIDAHIGALAAAPRHIARGAEADGGEPMGENDEEAEEAEEGEEGEVGEVGEGGGEEEGEEVGEGGEAAEVEGDSEDGEKGDLSSYLYDPLPSPTLEHEAASPPATDDSTVKRIDLTGDSPPAKLPCGFPDPNRPSQPPTALLPHCR